jgi:hypothetical protein
MKRGVHIMIEQTDRQKREIAVIDKNKTNITNIAGMIQPVETIKIIIGSRFMIMLSNGIQNNSKRTTRKKR